MSDENFMPSMSPVDDFMPRELYNPMVAAVWSIFFTPAFGEWCLLQNCKALDDDEGVFRSQSWFAGMIGAVFVYLLLPPFPGDKLLYIALYFAWFFGSCRPHGRMLLTLAPEYRRKSWLKPLFCGCGCYCLLGIIALLIWGVALL